MAVYYTKFCFGVDTTPEQHNWLEQMHHTFAKDTRLIASRPQPFPLEEADLLIRKKIMKITDVGELEFVWDNERTLISARENGDIAYTGALLQAFLTRFDLPTVIGFEWAHTCSTVSEHRFGGGAAVVTKTSILIQDTTELQKILAESIDF